MSKIFKIHAREILDSRGNPTIETDVYLENGVLGRASVPSGASTGSKEARELRDNDKKRFFGKGVLKAIENANKIIASVLIGKDARDQNEIDKIMIALDGISDKSNLGANAILGVSLANLKAAANNSGKPLFRYIGENFGGKKSGDDYLMPLPLINIINGGVHAGNGLDFQEFMIAPIAAKSFKEGLRKSAEVFYFLKKILKSRGLNIGVGDEGGFAPVLSSNKSALDLILEAIVKAGYKAGKDIALAMDAAAGEFCENGKYILKKDNLELNSGEMIEYFQNLIEEYPIISLEDGLAESDWDSWKILNEKLGKKIQIVGDDLFATNPKIIKKGINDKISNAVIIKPNQIGTVSETIEAVKIAQKAGWKAIISHRSGETEDTIIADLAVGLETGQIKTGSLSRTDRTAKYNQLLRIEETLGRKARFNTKLFPLK
ncbi:phosphopyruvate hydratase [Candidatus Wolfebacteria bacterium]|nr:phosphopyruvate hydratase [Candidatus Wolfebacteria bacterium]